MDAEEFWQVVERARVAVGPAADRARQEAQSPIAEALVAELTRLTLPEIVEFDRLFSEVRAQADAWDICAACWIIQYGFLSDDGFSDFQAGLVSMGRRTFEAVIANPDSLASHPAVQQISTSVGRSLWIGDEELLFAAHQAYEQLTGDAEAFWDAKSAEGTTTRPVGRKPEGDRWDLRNEGEWRKRLPRLGAMFLAHR